jgi:hypothetical protein
MIMTYQALRSAFPAVTLANSFYIQQSKVKIRALNTKPQNASVPALYPAGIPTYEYALQTYANVSKKIMDTINSVYKKNYKMDIFLEPQDFFIVHQDKEVFDLLAQDVQEFIAAFVSQIGTQLPPVPDPEATYNHL